LAASLSFGDGNEVKVACVPAGRVLGLGSRFEGGIVSEREADNTVVKVAATKRRRAERDDLRKNMIARERGAEPRIELKKTAASSHNFREFRRRLGEEEMSFRWSTAT
jgi:hypothetical protein